MSGVRPTAEFLEARSRDAVAKYLAFHQGDPQATEALRLQLSEGKNSFEIAQQLVVSAEQARQWSSQYLYMALGFPPAQADARAKSGGPGPRHSETTGMFESIIHEIFVPALKQSGFKKTRNVWRRRRGLIEDVVDIQRSWATGDLVCFTSNWAVLAPGLEVGSRRDVVVDGRIGQFIGNRHDRWWSVQLGWLARDSPDISDNSEQCRMEIASGLARMMAYLDDLDSLAKLREVARSDIARFTT